MSVRTWPLINIYKIGDFLIHFMFLNINKSIFLIEKIDFKHVKIRIFTKGHVQICEIYS